MINSARANSLSDLFNQDKSLIYFVPKYQREYICSKKIWELLFDDIITNDEELFLGSIICINTKVDSLKEDKLELIDGQQRMTTLSLLLLALYPHMKSIPIDNLDENEKEELNTDLINLKYRLLLKSDKSKLRIEPSISGNNKEDYYYLFSPKVDFLGRDLHHKPLNAGNRRIVRCYRYFLERYLIFYLVARRQ